MPRGAVSGRHADAVAFTLALWPLKLERYICNPTLTLFRELLKTVSCKGKLLIIICLPFHFRVVIPRDTKITIVIYLTQLSVLFHTLSPLVCSASTTLEKRTRETRLRLLSNARYLKIDISESLFSSLQLLIYSGFRTADKCQGHRISIVHQSTLNW